MLTWLISAGALLYLGYTLACAIGLTRAAYRAADDLPRARRTSYALLGGALAAFIGGVMALILIGLARTL